MHCVVKGAERGMRQNMKTAFLYSGQGSQKVGMGKDFYEKFPEVREVFDTPYTDFDLKSICFDGEESVLSRTRYTQPCMTAYAVSMTDLLMKNGIVPDYVAGLSLGEYSALYAAGVFDKRTVMELIDYRAKIMDDASQNADTAMAAIIGLAPEAVKEAVVSANDAGIVDVSNLNCKGQTVIGGEKNAVEKASELLRQAGAKRVVPLNVSGAFHTRLMDGASVLLRQKLDKAQFGEMKIPVLFNVSGGALPDGTDIKTALELQIKSTVNFTGIIETLHSNGVERVIEIGCGKVLCGFVKKTAPEIKTFAVEKVEDFLALTEETED